MVSTISGRSHSRHSFFLRGVGVQRSMVSEPGAPLFRSDQPAVCNVKFEPKLFNAKCPAHLHCGLRASGNAR
jgi:hypothetical protein